jgi:DNA-binding transcriptional regulator of glucitol operon
VGPAWFSRRAVLLHLTALVVVPGCLALGWWQLHRALSGNTLSWAYTVEWPFFAAYGVYMWWRILHEQPTKPSQTSSGSALDQPLTSEPDRYEEAEDEELAAYNRYLAQLNATDEHKLR